MNHPLHSLLQLLIVSSSFTHDFHGIFIFSVPIILSGGFVLPSLIISFHQVFFFRISSGIYWILSLLTTNPLSFCLRTSPLCLSFWMILSLGIEIQLTAVLFPSLITVPVAFHYLWAVLFLTRCQPSLWWCCSPGCKMPLCLS